ncbi:DUF2478 domain-containing protein [Bradyrhizobium elkanii]|uniref:DUF2478 domain-containing protein n=1 Tax=Bradyrhizobium elkanii TaxID=29448 RepID=UPI0009B60E5B
MSFRQGKKSRFPGSLFVSRALPGRVDLSAISKLRREDAAGGGLRGEFACTVARGAPLLTVISATCLTDFCTRLPYVYQVVKHWLRDVSTCLACSRFLSVASNPWRYARFHPG